MHAYPPATPHAHAATFQQVRLAQRPRRHHRNRRCRDAPVPHHNRWAFEFPLNPGIIDVHGNILGSVGESTHLCRDSNSVIIPTDAIMFKLRSPKTDLPCSLYLLRFPTGSAVTDFPTSLNQTPCALQPLRWYPVSSHWTVGGDTAKGESNARISCAKAVELQGTQSSSKCPTPSIPSQTSATRRYLYSLRSSNGSIVDVGIHGTGLLTLIYRFINELMNA